MSTKSGFAPAWVMASVVAMKVFGTVTTIDPFLTPAAIRANRTASVPLATPTQCPGSAEVAKSRSKPSTMGPPMKPPVFRAAGKDLAQLFFQLRMGSYQVQKGILPFVISLSIGRGKPAH